MSNRNRNYQKKGKNKPKNYQKKFDNISEKNNFQDAAEIKEYGKGYQAGKSGSHPGVARSNGDNDSHWYVPSNTLLANVASFPTDLSVGMPIDLEFIGKTSSGKHSPQTTPGILVYNTLPVSASDGSASDPINLSASALYTAMQVNSSRNPLYNANNLQLYILALTSAYALLAYMIRAYGTLRSFNIMNRYSPRALITAQGFDYEDLSENMANLRARINEFGYELASYYLPSEIDYCARQIFLNQNMYRDADTSKAQIYMFAPLGFLQWREGEVDPNDPNTPLPTYLKLTQPAGGMENITFKQISDYASQLMEPLRKSEDVRIMASDLIKAFGLGNSFTFQPISDDYAVTPLYNREVLMQFENAYIAPNCSQISLKYVQNVGINKDTISCEFTGKITSANWDLSGTTSPNAAVLNNLRKNILLNFHQDNPSPDDIMVGSRLSRSIFDGLDNMSFKNGEIEITGIKHSGSEIILGASLYYYDQNGDLQVDPICSEEIHCAPHATSADYQAIIRTVIERMDKLSRVAAFDWHPKLSFAFNNVDGTSDSATVGTPWIYDLETWLTITREEWDRMNEIAMYGLFECTLGDVPRLR